MSSHAWLVVRVCVCGLETRSRVVVSLLEPNYCVFGRTTRECVARRCVRGPWNYVRYGAVCERNGTVKWALGSGLSWKTVGRGQYDVGRAQVDRCVRGNHVRYGAVCERVIGIVFESRRGMSRVTASFGARRRSCFVCVARGVVFYDLDDWHCVGED